MSDDSQNPNPLSRTVYPFPKSGEVADNQAQTVEASAQEYFQALAEAEDGFFPIGYNGQWHGGIHFGKQTGTLLAQGAGLRCIADGQVIAYRIDEDYPTVKYKSCPPATYSKGFVLVRHRLQLPPAPRTDNKNGESSNSEDASASNAQPENEPSLVLYSLYMHLLNWVAYEENSELKRPGFWGSSTWLVGERAVDTRTTEDSSGSASTVTGMNIRDADGKLVGFAPRGVKLKLGEPDPARKAYYQIQEVVEGTTDPVDVVGRYIYKGTATSGEGLEPLNEPHAKGSVHIMSDPADIKAGDLIGHLGQYQRHLDMDSMAECASHRPLAQIDVFAGEGLKNFIDRGHIRDAQLDASRKTLLHIKSDARLVQPSEPDIELLGNEMVAVADAESSADAGWVSGRRGKTSVVDERPSGFVAATRTYGDGRIFLAAVSAAGEEITLDELNALSDSSTHPRRKLLTPTGGEVWVERSTVDVRGSVSISSRAWSSFPLQVANAQGDAVAHSRVIPVNSAESMVTEADGTRWFQIDAGTTSGGMVRGWARESGHPNVELCSPWAWPGFELFDVGELEPRELFARELASSGRAPPQERRDLEGSVRNIEQSPLFNALGRTIDTDDNQKVTPLELRRALNTPWLAQSLSRLVIRYPSEWSDRSDRWDRIDKLIEDPVLQEDWKHEKERIKSLLIWPDVAGQHDFPPHPTVHHLHPVGFIENFKFLRRHPVIVVNGEKTELEFLELYDGSTIDESDYISAAADLSCEVEAIKAVAMSETAATGSFYAEVNSDAVPAILYERHYFHRLTSGAHSDANPDISNASRGGYGKFSAQYPKLLKAYALNKSAALKSASWGKFQIMGANYSAAGYSSVEDFVVGMSISEKNHLKAFVSFIKEDSRLSRSIVSKDWLSFARAYNGPAQEGYDTKMRDNYNDLKAKN